MSQQTRKGRTRAVASSVISSSQEWMEMKMRPHNNSKMQAQSRIMILRLHQMTRQKKKRFKGKPLEHTGHQSGNHPWCWRSQRGTSTITSCPSTSAGTNCSSRGNPRSAQVHKSQQVSDETQDILPACPAAPSMMPMLWLNWRVKRHSIWMHICFSTKAYAKKRARRPRSNDYDATFTESRTQTRGQ